LAYKKYIIKPDTDLVQGNKFKIDYKKCLNPEQLEAVKHIDGPALVIAGAGTGKTRTIIYRVAYLIENKVNPSDILLLTFTRKAAREMLRKAATLLEDGRCEKVSGGTFHSFSSMVLRQYAQLIKYSNSFTVLDGSDSEDVISLLRSQMNIDIEKLRFPKKKTLKEIFSKSIKKDKKTDEIVEKDYPYYMEHIPKINEIFIRYNTYKRQYDMMDYDDLLLNLLFLLKTNDKVKNKIQDKYKYVMIDEYQDTNKLQAELVKVIVNKEQNVLAVGDDAQSIYSFRGANFKNILEFPSLFKNVKIIKLEQNYRSTKEILSVANVIINNASEKYTKNLFSHIDGTQKPWIVVAESEKFQSKFVSQKVLEFREEGIPLRDMAVLFRSSYHSFDLEIELSKSNIPFIKFGGFKFVETAHIKDIIAYLRLIINPKDVVSWHRVLLLIDGIGSKTAEKIIHEIENNRLKINQNSSFVKLGKSAENVLNLLKMLDKIYDPKMDIMSKIDIILKYYEPLFKTKYDDFTKRKKDIEIFQTIAERYTKVDEMLLDIALEPPTESVIDIEPESKEDEFLTLSTIHSAKGLEWKVVFMISALDGRFPSSKAIDTPDELAEERRLLYVACTRAKSYLYISYPTNVYDRTSGIILMKPSQLLEGLEEALVDLVSIEE
jgi:DNA helicase-2/ATP-dependent DNA helicase PcrA